MYGASSLVMREVEQIKNQEMEQEQQGQEQVEVQLSSRKSENKRKELLSMEGKRKTILSILLLTLNNHN